ncbi:hypothetical protein C8R46DRAFT_1350452 [Mycena filopes]|nr:hypothetical protein C8R46DRAFT_1350452 [Mycena filopes]
MSPCASTTPPPTSGPPPSSRPHAIPIAVSLVVKQPVRRASLNLACIVRHDLRLRPLTLNAHHDRPDTLRSNNQLTTPAVCGAAFPASPALVARGDRRPPQARASRSRISILAIPAHHSHTTLSVRSLRNLLVPIDEIPPVRGLSSSRTRAPTSPTRDTLQPVHSYAAQPRSPPRHHANSSNKKRKNPAVAIRMEPLPVSTQDDFPQVKLLAPVLPDIPNAVCAPPTSSPARPVLGPHKKRKELDEKEK